MAECLDKEAFKKSVEERYCKPCKADGKDHNGCWCRACWVDDMLDEVECFQSADVAPVTRCKDCKYSGMYCFGTSKEETLACLETEEDEFIRFATSVKADDYCSRGERKMGKEVADDKKQPEEAPGK